MTVLCPDDLAHDGWLYGWTSPVVCVVGVLDADTVRSAIVVRSLLIRADGGYTVAPSK